MANRREFLQIGVAASALSLANSGAAASPLPAAASVFAPSPALDFYKAVFDSRHADSVAFGEGMRRDGVPAHGMRGDITPFWFDELDAVWRGAPVPLAGMTYHGPLFCLERLAWERGLRVIWRAEHRVLPGGLLEHRVKGPETLVARARLGPLALARQDGGWSGALARLLQACPTGQAALDEARLCVPLSQPPAAADEPLISWIIAPARRA